MMSSPFPGMDPFIELDPGWQVFHGWFIRKLAEQSIGPARELGCDVDVERTVYGREPTGELVLIGEPDLLARQEPAFGRPEPGRGSGGGRPNVGSCQANRSGSPISTSSPVGSRP